MKVAVAACLAALALSAPLLAQQPVRQTDPSLLSLDTIFSYRPRSLGWHQWQADGSGYLMLEPAAAGKDAVDIVRYDADHGFHCNDRPNVYDAAAAADGWSRAVSWFDQYVAK